MVDGDEVDPTYIGIYEYFGYCQDGKIVVPIYDSRSCDIANELYDFVLGLIKEHINNALSTISNEKRFLAIAHEVKVRDIANEIYHLIFGEINELLIKSGLSAEPPYYQGEGRYFKSFERQKPYANDEK